MNIYLAMYLALVFLNSLGAIILTKREGRITLGELPPAIIAIAIPFLNVLTFIAICSMLFSEYSDTVIWEKKKK